VEYTPIILTGANALNKVLGRDVYSSNLQLGGTQIMHRNGISHLVASDDMDGVAMIINWLSYVPASLASPLPCLPTIDPIDRDIDCSIPAGIPYDPRCLLHGVESESEWVSVYGNESEKEWISGFFDKGSFTETLAGWAKGVVVGRGRLGGIDRFC
jgi:acetyl-CoA carboxylase/biotin carboxylase 1